MLFTLSAWLFGLVRGMGHALEPDHLAAVSTLVADTRGISRAGLLLGAAWGAGHTLMLLFVGGGLFLVRGHMPTALEHAFELLVAVMLVVLGVRALLRARREGLRDDDAGSLAATATAAGTPHHHAHGHTEGNAGARHRWTLARRPLVVGSIHGLAGSGALTAAVVAEMPTVTTGLVYMLVFGAGSALGMALLSGAVGASCARFARGRRALPTLLVASGLLSLGLGLTWGYSNARELAALSVSSP